MILPALIAAASLSATQGVPTRCLIEVGDLADNPRQLQDLEYRQSLLEVVADRQETVDRLYRAFKRTVEEAPDLRRLIADDFDNGVLTATEANGRLRELDVARERIRTLLVETLDRYPGCDFLRLERTLRDYRDPRIAPASLTPFE